MILKTTFYAPIIALREINPASSTLFPRRKPGAPFVTEGTWRRSTKQAASGT
jgi:hypothetical protein